MEHDPLRALSGPAEPPPELKRAVQRALRARGLLRRQQPWARLAYGGAAVLLFITGVVVGDRRGATPIDRRPRFAILLYGDSAFGRRGTESARVAEYNAWADSLARRGALVLGEKLATTGWSFEGQERVSRVDLGRSSGEHPLLGLFIVRATNEAEAVTIARSCPHLRHGGRLTIVSIVPT